MHKIDFYNPICIMKILPVRKRLSKPLASVATCASRQGNYRFRLANVFDSLFLPSRIFIIKQFFYKINFMFNFQKTRISGYLRTKLLILNSCRKMLPFCCCKYEKIKIFFKVFKIFSELISIL